MAVVQGRHEFDGQLPDWSRAGIEAEIARMHAARDAVLAFDDVAMTAEQKYQREYLVSRLDHDLFWAEKARWPFRNPQFYVGWMNDSLDCRRAYAPLASSVNRTEVGNERLRRPCTHTTIRFVGLKYPTAITLGPPIWLRELP